LGYRARLMLACPAATCARNVPDRLRARFRRVVLAVLLVAGLLLVA
jgi:hypothetical protein